MQTLDDLRRIVRRIESRQPPRAAREPVEKVLDGELVQTPEGPVVRVRRCYPLHHRHGGFALESALAPSPTLPRLLAPGWEGEVNARGLLFLDTETTGLAGGTGTYAFLVGAGYVDDGTFVVDQYFMRDLDQEPAVLASVAPLLERTTGVVTFNGGGFDLPLLETRFVLGRRRWPAGLPHLDLLRPARRVWSAGLEDCRLATLEREVLGVERADDVPGAFIPALYFDFLRTGRSVPLVRVLDHNRADVLSLVTLLGWFATVVDGGEGVAVRAHELAGLGRLWERLDVERAAGCYRQALAAGLAGMLGDWVRLRLAGWEKRRARWEAACALWEEAAQAGTFDPRPWEELAKFHEHRRRDLAAAHAIVHSALGLARAAAAPVRTLESFGYRLARLDRRLRVGSQSGRRGPASP